MSNKKHKCHFLKILQKKEENNQRQKSPRKNPTSKITQDLGYWGIGGDWGVLGGIN